MTTQKLSHYKVKKNTWYSDTTTEATGVRLMPDKKFSAKVHKLVHLPEENEPSKPKPVSEMICLLLKMNEIFQDFYVFMYIR